MKTPWCLKCGNTKESHNTPWCIKCHKEYIKQLQEEKQMNDDIYKMELHDQIIIDMNYMHYQVTRVPGGWIYCRYGTNIAGNDVFVPFHSVFMNHGGGENK